MELREIEAMIRLKTRHLGPEPTPEEIKTALDAIQRLSIQPVAKVRGTADYTTTKASDSVPLSAVATDIYKINMVTEVTDGRGRDIGLVNEDDFLSTGVRRSADTLYFQGIEAGKTVRLYYEKRLRPLGRDTGQVSTPDIDADYHDLYWLGVAGFLDPDPVQELRFRERLGEFTALRDRATRPRGRRVHTQPWR